MSWPLLLCVFAQFLLLCKYRLAFDLYPSIISKYTLLFQCLISDSRAYVNLVQPKN